MGGDKTFIGEYLRETVSPTAKSLQDNFVLSQISTFPNKK